MKNKVSPEDIKLLRYNIGAFTQDNFGRLLGVTDQTVRRWEKGTATPTGLELQFIMMMMDELCCLSEEVFLDNAIYRGNSRKELIEETEYLRKVFHSERGLQRSQLMFPGVFVLIKKACPELVKSPT
jgi:DNA-binding XRE family transcriptional regulator